MISYTMQKSISMNQAWPYVFTLHMLLALTLLTTNTGSVCANAVTPEIPAASDNENEFMMGNDATLEEKRNWQSLQGSWGKRAFNDIDYSSDSIDSDQAIPVLLATNMEDRPKLQLAFLANPAVIDQLPNGQKSLASFDNGDLEDENIFNEKRGWKKMNVAWGKRRNAGQYLNRDFVPSAAATGSWGKREPNWNNLKGMWGKRATSRGWHKLHNGWGKRSPQFTESN